MPALIRSAVLTASLALAACAADEGALPPGPGVPPLDVSGAETAVDGLTVGHRLMAAGEYRLALRAYTRAVSEQGANADVLSAIGSANLKLGRLGQAERFLRRALERDQKFVPAINNLGVVLMEQGKYGEASRVFQTAFALDSGQSAEIRQNLQLALAKIENSGYDPSQNNKFSLVRRGNGQYLLLSTP